MYAFRIGLIRQIILPPAVFYLFTDVLGWGLESLWWGFFLITWSAAIYTWFYTRRKMGTISRGSAG